MIGLQTVDHSRLVRRHTVSLLHDLTGEPITAISAELLSPPSPGWSIRVARGRVIVSALDRHHEPGVVPRVAVSVTHPALRERLETPDVELDLGTVETIHRFVAKPSVVTVTVLDQDGAPVPGRSLSLHGRTPSAPVALNELGGGVYATAATTWVSAMARPTVHVDAASTARVVGIDPTRASISLTLIHPTT